MRVLVLDPGPAFSVRDVHDGWVKALRQLGCQVADFNLGDRCDFYARARLERDGEFVPALDDGQALGMVMNGVKAACYEFWPDVVVVVSAFYIPEHIYGLLRSRHHKIVILHTEEPYEHDRAIRLAGLADVNVLNDPTNLEAFRQACPQSVYIPHAYDPDRHKPGPVDPDLACDFAFVGTGYPSRIEFFEQVRWPTESVLFAGNWQWTKDGSPIRRFMAHELDRCTPNDETVRLYNSCKASANLYRREADRPELSHGWAMGPREVELAASHTFFLRESRREGDEVLSSLPVFDGPDEFSDVLAWWLSHDDLRERAVAEAAAAVADRTFVNNAKHLLQML